MKNPLLLRLSLPSVIMFTLLAGCQPGGKSERISNSIAFTDVNVITMENDLVLENHTVVIRGDRIVKIGVAGSIELPADVQLIDGRSKYLMPGLADMHVHVHDANDMLLFVANGVTTVRNMSGEPKHLELREKAISRELIGPTMYTSGPVIDGDEQRWAGSAKPPLLANDGAQYQMVTSDQEIAAAIREQKRLGYDFLKIYDNLTAEEYDAIRKYAKEEGMAITGHVPFGVDVATALDSGHRSIEHFSGYLYKIYQGIPDGDLGWDKFSRMTAWSFIEMDAEEFPELIKATIESSTWHCPTLSRYIKTMSPTSEHMERLELPGMKYYSYTRIEREKNRNQRNGFSHFTEEDYQKAKQGHASKKKFVALMHELSQFLVCGKTDKPVIRPYEDFRTLFVH